MVQPSGSGSPRSTYRERQRIQRRREFLDTARAIVTTSGILGLTMQRVTDELESSSGGIYNYFPSKDDLVAALQTESLETLNAAFVRGQDALARMLLGTETADAALTHVIAAGHFWIDAEASMPVDLELARRLFAGAGSTTAAHVTTALPAALSFLNSSRNRVDAAVDSGVLEEGNGLHRALLLISSVNGALLTSHVGPWDTELFDGRRLASQLIAELARGWGASPDRVAVAQELLAEFNRVSTLAPSAD